MLNTILPIYPDLSVGGNTDHTGSLSRWHPCVRRDLQLKKGSRIKAVDRAVIIQVKTIALSNNGGAMTGSGAITIKE